MMTGTALVSARRGDEELVARMTFSAGETCIVEVDLSDGTSGRGEGVDLFDALVAARLALEGQGVFLACAGARRDVYPSPMLRQATQGRRAYLLVERSGQTRPPSVDIFDCAEWTSIASVNEQREAFTAWLGKRPEGMESE